MITRADLKLVRSLKERKHREAEGLYAVEGDKVVGELLAAGVAFERIYATGAWTGPRTESATEDEMSRMSHFPTPSPVLAVGRIAEAALAKGELRRGLTLALDSVQDPGNVGTILRIADWYGIARVLLSPGCADLYSAKVIHASMGSFARVKAVRAELPALLASAGVPVLGCTLDGADIHAVARHPDAVVAIGSEGRGLSEEVLACVTARVTIPRLGAAESLNAAVAAAVVCDNLRRTERP